MRARVNGIAQHIDLCCAFYESLAQPSQYGEASLDLILLHVVIVQVLYELIIRPAEMYAFEMCIEDTKGVSADLYIARYKNISTLRCEMLSIFRHDRVTAVGCNS